jgi:hypothetical protein
MKIQLNQVVSVYVGKNGCMCGCNGKYFYAKAFQEKAGKTRGYAVSDDEINDEKIKEVVDFLDDAEDAVIDCEYRPTVYHEGYVSTRVAYFD